MVPDPGRLRLGRPFTTRTRTPHDGRRKAPRSTGVRPGGFKINFDSSLEGCQLRVSGRPRSDHAATVTSRMCRELPKNTKETPRWPAERGSDASVVAWRQLYR